MPILDKKLKESNITIKPLIIDSGLGRFGVLPKNVVEFAKEVSKYENIELVGISTHPGHVYSSQNMKEVEKYAEQEVTIMRVGSQE